MDTIRYWLNKNKKSEKDMWMDDESLISFFCDPYYVTDNEEIISKTDIKNDEDVFNLVSKINEDSNEYDIKSGEWQLIPADEAIVH